MKEAPVAMASSTARGVGEKVRGVSDKEKTKMRERQRRSITTNIFHGLCKNGGYPLSPRSDINEVLRHLATEAGWTVHPDSTTYRHSPPPFPVFPSCPVCGSGKSSAASTPSSSVVLGGESSTTASPRRLQLGGPLTSPYLAGLDDIVTSERDVPLELCMYGGIQHSGATGEVSMAPGYVSAAAAGVDGRGESIQP